jgi:hypothetical protein
MPRYQQKVAEGTRLIHCAPVYWWSICLLPFEVHKPEVILDATNWRDPGWRGCPNTIYANVVPQTIHLQLLYGG